MKRPWLAAAALLLGSVAYAQPGAGRPGRPGGGGFGGPGGGMRMPGMRMMNRDVTLSQVPLPTLKAALKLNAAQEKKIDGIRTRAREGMRSLFQMPRQGERPDPKAMEATMKKMEAAGKKSDADIKAVLTPAQRKQVPGLLKEAEALRGSGLPIGVAGGLNLTADQVGKLSAIGKKRSDASAKLFQGNGDPRAAFEKMGKLRDAARKQAMGVLNAKQKAAVEKWEKDNPRGGFGMGGPGGRMGAPGGMGAPGPMARPGGGRGR